MKTPIQEHIEWLKSEHKKYTDQAQKESSMQILGYAFKIDDCIKHAESMLEKEKALLIKTHGNKKVYDSQIDPTIVTGEEWYNETFKTKER